MIKVAVAGAAGRMGQTVCAAVEGADGLELTGKADPALGTPVSVVLDGAEVLVDFTVPDSALANAREAVAAGVHAVIGTTGFDLDELDDLAGASANVFVAPNFAIGAVLMMMFAAQAARHMPKAEIIELHHDGKLDRPSGTAARMAALIRDAAPALGEVPIHSVRLPGLVAHRGTGAHDPSRLDRPRIVHARCPAGDQARGGTVGVPGDRVGEPSVGPGSPSSTGAPASSLSRNPSARPARAARAARSSLSSIPWR